MFAAQRQRRRIATVLIGVALLVAAPSSLLGRKKKHKDDGSKPKPNFLQTLDLSRIVWPNPPAIARVKFLNYFAGEKYSPQQQKMKTGWMDRLAGITAGPQIRKPRFQLVVPYGLAVDSKGYVYVADSKVRAVFVFHPDNGDVDLIKNGVHARFKWMTGLAIDDADRLFIADSGMRRVLVFDPQHKLEGSISEGMLDPGGMAVDNENRFLYVADAERDQVLVYDADTYKLLRTIGTTGKQHRLTSPGDFSRPTNVAVDQDGNLYVSDTMNDRIEVFDADGEFIRAFGKAGDGPGYFARPKGIAIDSDGHVWVADGVQDRVQVFTPEGRLLIYLGGHGLLPGQFSALAGLTIDQKSHRVFTSEQFPGRVQMFRYVTDAEAKAEREGSAAGEKEKAAGAPKAGAAGEPQKSAAK